MLVREPEIPDVVCSAKQTHNTGLNAENRLLYICPRETTAGKQVYIFSRVTH